jgi:hypothetical protein
MSPLLTPSIGENQLTGISILNAAALAPRCILDSVLFKLFCDYFWPFDFTQLANLTVEGVGFILFPYLP